MKALKLLNHIVKHFKGFAFTSFLVLTSPIAQASYYNLGAMLQGPKLVFSIQPSSSATVGTAFLTQPSVSIVKPNGSIVSSATDSITLSAYSDSRCTTAAGGSLTAASNPKVAVSGVAAFTSVTYSATGKIYIKASASGKKPACSSPVVVTQAVVAGPDPAQFKLAILGPSSIGTNNCTAYTVALRDQFNGIVTTTSAISIKYSGAGSGSFYSDAGCTASSNTGNIAANANQTTVYYKSAVVEANLLQASDQANQVVDGSLTVSIFGYKLSLTGSQTVDTGTTCEAYNIQHSLSGGGSGGVTNVDITGYQGVIYSNSGCTTVISGSGPVATNASGAATFYLKGPAAQTGVPFYITINATSAASASLAVGVTSGGAITKLVWSGSLTPVTGRCAPYYVTAQDLSSTIQPTPLAIPITLTKTNNAVFYSDNGCKISTSSVTIPAGSSQATVYLKDAFTESSVLTAQASGLTQDQITVTTSAGAATPNVAAGYDHTCALMADKTVKCWGNNTYGQLGNGTYTSSLTPVLVQGLTGVTAISAGSSFTCALTAGTVKCWGQGTAGQLGNLANNKSNVPVDVFGISSIIAITAGSSHACAMSASNVSCWGLNSTGQLGDNSTNNANYPQNSLSGSPIAISAGLDHTCAVVSGGSVKCWGNNASGQLGNNSTTQSLIPVNVNSISTAAAISVGKYFSCALLTTQGIKCWGNNAYGQLGNNSTTQSLIPVDVNSISTVSAITAGTEHTCAVISGGSAKCWGNNASGQLGNNSTMQSLIPVNVNSVSTASAISAGDGYTCTVLADQTMRCWGKNINGQLGNGNSAQITTPTTALTPTGVTAVASGSGFTCAQLNDKKIQCWGINTNGQLGNGATDHSITPVFANGITNAIALSAGTSFVCALLATQDVKCWGNNGTGQLGNNSTTSSSVPVDVSGVSTATTIATGGGHACALLADHTVKCWGNNDKGQLGNISAPNPSLVPVSVDGISTATALSLGNKHSCALLANQTIKCWGFNTSGQLGNSSTVDSLTPVDVTGITTAIALAGGGNGANHSCAIMSNQTIKCWGANTNGQLGNATTTTSATSTPVTTVGINNAYLISLGGSVSNAHTCAILTDKSMRCWGSNSNGQLGNGSTVSSPTPVNVLSISPYNSVGAGNLNTCGILPDQTIKCNGANDYGQSGVNTLVPGYVLEIPQ